MITAVAPAQKTRTAHLIRSAQDHYIIEIDGCVHTLRNLLGVDQIQELEGPAAVNFLNEILHKPVLAAVN